MGVETPQGSSYISHVSGQRVGPAGPLFASAGESSDSLPLLTGRQIYRESKKEREKEKKVETRIDWLAMSFSEKLPYVEELACNALRCEKGEWTETGQGIRGFPKMVIGPAGAKIAWGAKNHDKIYLVLPGQACAVMGEAMTLAVMVEGVRVEAHPTRIDLAIDDYDRRVSPQEIEQLMTSGYAVTRARSVVPYAKRKMGTGEYQGFTAQAGERKSRVVYRAYDKWLQSKGQIDSYRHELEVKQEAAEVLMPKLVAAGEDWRMEVRTAFRSFIDFRELDAGATHTADRTPMAWWDDLLEGATKGKLYPPEEPRTLDKVLDYAFTAQAQSYAMIRARYGSAMLEEIANHGMTMLRAKHRRMLAAAGVKA